MSFWKKLRSVEAATHNMATTPEQSGRCRIHAVQVEQFDSAEPKWLHERLKASVCEVDRAEWFDASLSPCPAQVSVLVVTCAIPEAETNRPFEAASTPLYESGLPSRTVIGPLLTADDTYHDPSPCSSR